MKPVTPLYSASTHGRSRLKIAIVIMRVDSRDAGDVNAPRMGGFELGNVISAHPAVGKVDTLPTADNMVAPPGYDGMVITWTEGPLHTWFHHGSVPTLVPEYQRNAVTGDEGAHAALWTDASVEQLNTWLNWLSNQPPMRGDQLSELIEELIGVVDSLVVENEDLRMWADALVNEVTDLTSAVDEWQIYARDLKLTIAELSAKNRDLWAQLGQHRLSRKRVVATITGLATAVSLLQGPMVYEWYQEHFTGRAANPPTKPTIAEIVETISERCAAIERQIGNELPDKD